MISKEILLKFKNLYQEKFNISLTDEEVTQMATDLVNLVQILLKPEPEEIKEDIHMEGGRTHDEIISATPH